MKRVKKLLPIFFILFLGPIFTLAAPVCPETAAEIILAQSDLDSLLLPVGPGGVPRVSALGFFSNAVLNMARPHVVLNRIHSKYGAVAKLDVPGKPQQFYFLADPSAIDEVLDGTVNGKNGTWEKSPLFGKAFEPFVGTNNLFTATLDTAKRQRRDAAHLFQKSDFITTEFTNDMQSMLGRQTSHWNQLIEQGQGVAKIDVGNEMTDSTLGGLFQTFFGHELQREELTEIKSALEPILRSFTKEAANPFGTAIHDMPNLLPGQKKLKEAHQKLDQFVKKMIDKRKNEPAKPGRRQDLLDTFLNAKKADGTPVDEIEVINQFKTYLLAGHETTASALKWAYYQVLKDPKVKEKLLAEVRTYFKDRKVVNAEDLANLPYLDQVWMENLRLNSPAPVLARRAEVDQVIKVGQVSVDVKKGDDMVLSVIEANRSEATWGVQSTGHSAADFNPDRFSPQSIADHKIKMSKMLTYGSGSRICIGQHFANAEGKMIMAQMLLDYDMDLVSSAQRINVRSDISYSIQGPLIINLQHRR